MTPVEFNDSFPAAYRIEVLDSEPPNALVFERQGSIRSGEVVVEVTAADGDSWVGVAKPGAPSVRGAVSGVFSTPSPIRLLVVSKGDAYLADVHAPEQFQVVDTGGPVVAVRPAVAEHLLLLASPWSITAIDEPGVRWQTDRLAIEGVRMDEVENGRLAGVADPADEEPRDFVVDLRTGRHEGGVPFA